jgi:hypothetical protein
MSIKYNLKLIWLSFRHWCDQNDHLKYGWTYHDGETFGIENIKDNNLQLNIQWMRQLGGQHGGDWTTRIHVMPQVWIEKIFNARSFSNRIRGRNTNKFINENLYAFI